MLFSLVEHHLCLNITDTALKVSRSLYCFTTFISRGVENYFPRLWGTGISDAIYCPLSDKAQLQFTTVVEIKLVDNSFNVEMTHLCIFHFGVLVKNCSDSGISKKFFVLAYPES